VLFAEALAAALRAGDAAHRRDQIQTAIIEVAIGLAVIVVVGRTGRQRIGGLIASLPLAVIGFAGFKLGGF
jgi:hypothetical protein